MITFCSPVFSLLERALDAVESHVVAPLAARFYQFVPHCSGCGGPPPYDPLDCEGCMPALDPNDGGLAWTPTMFRQAEGRALRQRSGPPPAVRFTPTRIPLRPYQQRIVDYVSSMSVRPLSPEEAARAAELAEELKSLSLPEIVTLGAPRRS